MSENEQFESYSHLLYLLQEQFGDKSQILRIFFNASYVALEIRVEKSVVILEADVPEPPPQIAWVTIEWKRCNQRLTQHLLEMSGVPG